MRSVVKVRQKSPGKDMNRARIIAFEDGQQVSEVRFSAEFIDQANVGFTQSSSLMSGS